MCPRPEDKRLDPEGTLSPNCLASLAIAEGLQAGCLDGLTGTCAHEPTGTHVHRLLQAPFRFRLGHPCSTGTPPPNPQHPTTPPSRPPPLHIKHHAEVFTQAHAMARHDTTLTPACSRVRRHARQVTQGGGTAHYAQSLIGPQKTEILRYQRQTDRKRERGRGGETGMDKCARAINAPPQTPRHTQRRI